MDKFKEIKKPIKFIDWYKFNFVDNTVMSEKDDVYIKIFGHKTFCEEDMVLGTTVNVSIAAKLFGDLYLMAVTGHDQLLIDAGNEHAFCILLYMEDTDD